MNCILCLRETNLVLCPLALPHLVGIEISLHHAFVFKNTGVF